MMRRASHVPLYRSGIQEASITECTYSVQGCQDKVLNYPENPENLKKVTFYYSFLPLEHHKGYIAANQ